MNKLRHSALIAFIGLASACSSKGLTPEPPQVPVRVQAEEIQTPDNTAVAEIEAFNLSARNTLSNQVDRTCGSVKNALPMRSGLPGVTPDGKVAELARRNLVHVDGCRKKHFRPSVLRRKNEILNLEKIRADLETRSQEKGIQTPIDTSPSLREEVLKFKAESQILREAISGARTLG